MTRHARTLTILLLGFFLLAAQNVWAFGLIDSAFLHGAMNRAIKMDTPLGVGSSVNYPRARVDSVHLFAVDLNGAYQAPQCSAVIITDDQKTVSVSTDLNA